MERSVSESNRLEYPGRTVISMTDKGLRNVGFQIARGVAEFVVVVLFVVVLAGLVISGMYPAPTDDSDASPWERSGLQPLTDQKTGCEYLRTSGGAITPRLDQGGLPICGKSQSSR